MKCYVINLDRSPERMSWMASQLQQFGIFYERVQAVDGNSLTKKDLLRHSANRVDGIQWAPTEIGCLLSHRECWTRISMGAERYGVVFEDDLHLSREVALLVSTDAWVPDGVELVKMEAPSANMRSGMTGYSSDVHYIQLADIPWNGTGCYLISRELAASLSKISAFQYPVDRFLFDNSLARREFAGYEIRPGICIQASLLGEEEGPLSSELDEDRRRTAAMQRSRRPQSAAGILCREALRPFIRGQKRLVRFYRNLSTRRYKVDFLEISKL